MSEVKRWYIGVYGGEAQARVCAPHPHEFIRDTEGVIFVLAEQFDACEARNRALQQRLTAADERADVLEGWLRRWSAEAGGIFCALKYETDAALKPAERTNTSGKAHCPHDGICHTSDETCAEARARIDSVKPVEGGSDE